MLFYKQCSGCGEEFPRDNKHFYKNNQAKDELDNYCITCRKGKNKEHAIYQAFRVTPRGYQEVEGIVHLELKDVQAMELDPDKVYRIDKFVSLNWIVEYIKGSPIQQTKDFIVFQTINGYKECFNKVDFKSGLARYKEVYD